MSIEQNIKQLNIILAQLAAQGIGRKDKRYKRIREQLDRLQEKKGKKQLNNLNISKSKDIFRKKENKVRIPEVSKSEIITKDEDIYYFKNGVMIPEGIVKRLVDEAQAKSAYFVLGSLAKFCDGEGVVSHKKVEDLAKWCGYKDSSTYRFGLNWLEENGFISVDRSSKVNSYRVNDYIFGRAIIIPAEDLEGKAKETRTKKLRLKWTYYLRNHHSPNNKRGKFDLSLGNLKEMVNGVSIKEVINLANELKGEFFDKLELIKSGISKAKDKLKVEFNNFKLGIVDNLDEEVERVNHHQYFSRVCQVFKDLAIKLSLPNFRKAYGVIEEIGEFYLDRVCLKAKSRDVVSDRGSVGYFIYLMRREEGFKLIKN
ncbi:hypothetical protein [Halonatronum saccharophilum]|uniref:hypothetical protein n=1 Tax=Halonatronum saccharophilum TaxID=150060 RepID=UPI000481BBF2|nr:hypothetical protein [Halonatronum saccharophilum]